MQINLPTQTSYYDVHLATGFIQGQSVVIRNGTAKTLLVVISPTLPTSDAGCVLVPTGEEYVFSSKISKLWIKGAIGPIYCETLVAGVSGPFERVDLSPDLYTSNTEGFRRIRVDSGQTGFFEGREFRTFFEISLATGTSSYIKFVSPVDFIIFEQSLTLDAGSVRFTALTGATSVGTYSNILPVIGKNRMSVRKSPFYVSQCTLASGGTVTGGTVVELFRVTAANATAQQQTVLGAASTERGLPAGTYFLRIENIGNGTATGVYSLIWEERP